MDLKKYRPVWLTRDLHQLIKVIAYMRDTNITQTINDIVEDAVKELDVNSDEVKALIEKYKS